MDVTERKHAEENLRQSEAYLVEAQKLTHTGSWVWSSSQRRYIYPRNGIAYTASIRRMACRLGTNGWSAYIRMIEPGGKEQSIKQ